MKPATRWLRAIYCARVVGSADEDGEESPQAAAISATPT
jgi:hypothetical protein